MIVVGIDLSLTDTGIASRGWVERVKSKANGDGLGQRSDRILGLAERILVLGIAADLVVVEAPAYSSGYGNPHERSGLWWLVVAGFRQRGIPVAEVAPTTLKKYLTGNGRADKDEVLAEVCKRFPGWDIRNNNEADALGLAAMGYDWLGEPLLSLPALNRRSLAVVKWPGELEGSSPEPEKKSPRLPRAAGRK